MNNVRMYIDNFAVYGPIWVTTFLFVAGLLMIGPISNLMKI